MKRVCLINGSLRGEKASSLAFLKDMHKRAVRSGLVTELVTVKFRPEREYPEETLRSVAESDAVIIAFPLFAYTTPGSLTRFFEEFYAYKKNGGARSGTPSLYAIVNSGFPEPPVCEEAVRVIRNFGARVGLEYRFSIAIASGPITAVTKKVPLLNPKLKKAFANIILDITGEKPVEVKDVFVKPLLPKRLILWIKDQFEKKFV